MSNPAVDFLPARDSLLRGAALEFAVTFPVLGIDTRFESNSRYVLDVASESFNEWRTLAAADRSTPGSVSVRVVVHGASERSAPHSPVRHISTDDGRLFVHTAGSLAIVDPARRDSLAYVTADLVADREHFRDFVLEAITLALLASFDRHPIHAAAIARDGHAVLFAAPGGTGKSTLAYVAHRSGIDVVSDDRVWVQLEPALRIWGGGRSVRLRADAAIHFPELSPLAATSVVNGEEKTVLKLAELPNGRQLVCNTAAVCVMTRGETVALERIDGSEVHQELARQLAPGFDRFAGRHDDVVRALTTHGGWRLTLSNNPLDVLPFLYRMLDAR